MYHNFIAKTDQLGVLKILLMSNFNYPVFNEQLLLRVNLSKLNKVNSTNVFP